MRHAVFVWGAGAGNFVDLVDRGFYSKMAIQRSDGFVIQVAVSCTKTCHALLHA